MLIIRRQDGIIINNPKNIWACSDGRLYACDDLRLNPFRWDAITGKLPSKKAVCLTLDWIFERIEHQRANPNIVVDVNKCPFLKVKEDVQDEGASIEELRF